MLRTYLSAVLKMIWSSCASPDVGTSAGITAGAFGSIEARTFAVTVGANALKKGTFVMLAKMKRAKTVMTDALKERIWGTRRVICIRFRSPCELTVSGQRLRRLASQELSRLGGCACGRNDPCQRANIETGNEMERIAI